jgi:mannose-6-phosphate isomerase-like protein (cupin superfamily)
MARTGDVIEHLTGEHFEFRKTAEDTGGELLRIEALVEPRGFAAAEHVHPRQEERFEILSGEIRYRVGGVERVAGPGEELVIPRGVTHVWENAGEENLHMIIEFRPALRTEEFFESYFGLGQDGLTNPKTGLPNLVRMAVLLNEFREEIHLSRPPLLVQRIVFGTLALVGRLLGYPARYPYPYGRQREASTATR